MLEAILIQIEKNTRKKTVLHQKHLFPQIELDVVIERRKKNNKFILYGSISVNLKFEFRHQALPHNSSAMHNTNQKLWNFQ